MLDTLDYHGLGDTRIAVFDWTGLSALNNPARLARIKFGGQLFSGTEYYYDPDPLAAQKAGPIPLGDECGAAGLSAGTPAPASCPEGGVETNGDFMTQVSQAQGQLWGGTETEVNQTFGSASEVHQAIAYWVVGTKSFDATGAFTLTSQGYVSAAHEDVAFAAIGAGGYPWQDRGNGAAVMTFTLTGNDFYPEHRLRQADVHLRRAARVGDQRRRPRQVPAGRVHRVPRLPRSPPARAGATTAGRSTTADASTSPASTSRTGTARDRRSP